MPVQQQGELFPHTDRHPASGPELAPVWLQRLSLLVLVIFCFYIGGLITLMPWFSQTWRQNGLVLAHPALNHLAHAGWFRGLVSGIGLLDIWIGISELIHYRDYRPPQA